jgi:hypothetical protein
MREAFYLAVPGGSKALDRGLVNAFEKEDSSLVSSHGQSLGRSLTRCQSKPAEILMEVSEANGDRCIETCHTRWACFISMKSKNAALHAGVVKAHHRERDQGKPDGPLFDDEALHAALKSNTEWEKEVPARHQHHGVEQSQSLIELGLGRLEDRKAPGSQCSKNDEGQPECEELHENEDPDHHPLAPR